MTEQTDTSSAPTAPAYNLSSLGAVLCVPTYGPVDPLCARSVRLAVMFAANKGLKWHGDVSPDRLGYGAARNTSVQFTLTEQPEADGIMWVDSDIKTPLWGIARLLDTVIGGNMDFASGVYHQRSPIHTPIFYHYNEDLKLFQPADDYPPNYIGNADGCGFGFCWTSANMLRAMSKHSSFTSNGGWFPDRRDIGGFGEDLSFCYMAREAGFKLYIDTGVQVGHAADARFIYEEDFRREKAKFVQSPEYTERSETVFRPKGYGPNGKW